MCLVLTGSGLLHGEDVQGNGSRAGKGGRGKSSREKLYNVMRDRQVQNGSSEWFLVKMYKVIETQGVFRGWWFSLKMFDVMGVRQLHKGDPW